MGRGKSKREKLVLGTAEKGRRFANNEWGKSPSKVSSDCEELERFRHVDGRCGNQERSKALR